MAIAVDLVAIAINLVAIAVDLVAIVVDSIAIIGFSGYSGGFSSYSSCYNGGFSGFSVSSCRSWREGMQLPIHVNVDSEILNVTIHNTNVQCRHVVASFSFTHCIIGGAKGYLSLHRPPEP